MLSRTPIADRAIEKLDLLDRVVEHKKVFFRSGWANYDAARAGTIRLAPPESKLQSLRLDYTKMRDMFFGATPGFDDIVKGLRLLEAWINDAIARANIPGTA